MPVPAHLPFEQGGGLQLRSSSDMPLNVLPTIIGGPFSTAGSGYSKLYKLDSCIGCGCLSLEHCRLPDVALPFRPGFAVMISEWRRGRGHD